MPSRAFAGTPPAGTAPLFQSDFPSAIAPSAAIPALPPSGPYDSSPHIAHQSIPPDRLSIVEPSSRGSGSYPPAAPTADAANAGAAPNRTLLFVLIAVLVLIVGAAATLGILYYQGWFDDDPEPTPRPHKTLPKPHPTHTAPAPTHTPPAPTLR